MTTSKVKWFNEKKGFGFIVNPEGGDDIFFHYSAIVSRERFKYLKQEAEVDFDLDKTGKRLQAKSVWETLPSY